MSRGVSDKITYKPYNQGEQWLLPPSLDELVPQNHFVRIVSKTVDELKRFIFCRQSCFFDRQAESLIITLLLDETFKEVSATERKRITERILDEVKGRMLEEIVQLETKKANPDLEVFKLQSNRIQIWNNSGESSSLSWRKY